MATQLRRHSYKKTLEIPSNITGVPPQCLDLYQFSVAAARLAAGATPPAATPPEAQVDGAAPTRAPSCTTTPAGARRSGTMTVAAGGVGMCFMCDAVRAEYVAGDRDECLIHVEPRLAGGLHVHHAMLPRKFRRLARRHLPPRSLVGLRPHED